MKSLYKIAQQNIPRFVKPLVLVYHYLFQKVSSACSGKMIIASAVQQTTVPRSFPENERNSIAPRSSTQC